MTACYQAGPEQSPFHPSFSSSLVIEDNTDIRENIAEILDLYAYEVIVAEDGIIGLEKAVACNPDLVLCDIVMPKLDGLALLRQLKNDPQLSGIPVIVLTALTEKENTERAKQEGAAGYVFKPFDPDELIQRISTILALAAGSAIPFTGLSCPDSLLLHACQ